jgi:hypothetical protein
MNGALEYPRPDGSVLKFGLIPRSERAAIIKQLVAARRERMVENLKLAGVTGESLYAELEAFDVEPPSYSAWVQYVNSEDGQNDLHLRGLRRLNPSATQEDVDRLYLDERESLEVAVKLVGMVLKQKSAADEEPPPDRPSEPDCYGPPK